MAVSYTHLRAHETVLDHVCRLLLEKINRIKVVLAEKQKTNKWLATELGINPSTVSKWCTNSSQPDIALLVKIAKLLEVELDELLDKNFVESI